MARQGVLRWRRGYCEHFLLTINFFNQNVKDLYQWWFKMVCRNGKIRMVPRRWRDVVSDPRFVHWHDDMTCDQKLDTNTLTSHQKLDTNTNTVLQLTRMSDLEIDRWYNAVIMLSSRMYLPLVFCKIEMINLKLWHMRFLKIPFIYSFGNWRR